MICKYCGKFLINHKCIYCGTFSEKSPISAEDVFDVRICEEKIQNVQSSVAQAQAELDLYSSAAIQMESLKTPKDVFKAWLNHSEHGKSIYYSTWALAIIFMVLLLYIMLGAYGFAKLPPRLDEVLSFRNVSGSTVKEVISEVILFNLKMIFTTFIPVVFLAGAFSLWYMIDYSKWLNREKIDYRSIHKTNRSNYWNYRFSRALKYAGLFKDDELCKKVTHVRLAYSVICTILTTIQAILFVFGIINLTIFLSLGFVECFIPIPSSVFLMAKVKSNLKHTK